MPLLQINKLAIYVIRVYLVFISFVNSFDNFVYEILPVIPNKRVLKGALSNINGETAFSKRSIIRLIGS